jgi:hypothetical protein
VPTLSPLPFDKVFHMKACMKICIHFVVYFRTTVLRILVSELVHNLLATDPPSPNRGVAGVIIPSIPRIHIASQQQLFFQPLFLVSVPRLCTAVIGCFSFVVIKITTVSCLVMVCCVFSQLKNSGSTTISMSRSSIFLVLKDRSLRPESWEMLNRDLCLVYSALRVALPAACSRTSLLL